jgi:hypothetical protein
MANTLGTIEIPDELRAGMKHYERLEGSRSAEQLKEKAAKAYLATLKNVIENDEAIQEELAKSLPPKSSRKPIALAS